MAKRKEFFALCPDCHSVYEETRLEVQKPIQFYGIIVWDPPTDLKLGELLQILGAQSPLLHDLAHHHELVGHHLFHSRFILFDHPIEPIDQIEVFNNESDLSKRYPDCVALLDKHIGGQIIFFREQSSAQEIPTPLDYGEYQS